MIADQRCDFKIIISGPVAYLADFFRVEEAEVGVAADQVCLLADREAVVSNLSAS